MGICNGGSVYKELKINSNGTPLGTTSELDSLLKKACSLYTDKQYSSSIYLFYKELYKRSPKMLENITPIKLKDAEFFTFLAEETLRNLNNLIVDNEVVLFGICININNICSGIFVPKRYEVINRCLRLQTANMMIYRTLVNHLNNSNIKITLDDVNIINYTYAILEANLGILLINSPESDNRRDGKSFLEKSIDRLTTLIKVDPSPVYLKAKGQLLLLLNRQDESDECIKRALSAKENDKNASLADLDNTIYRTLLKANHKIVLYK